MDQKQFFNAHAEKKTAYELSTTEFATLLPNLRLFGDLAKVALIASNDRKRGKRPRIHPTKEAVELLHDVLGEENAEDANIELTDLDVLRVERAEVNWAVQHPRVSELHKKKGSIVLGLATMASAMNELRRPIIENSPWLKEPDMMREMLDQFHQEGVERISSQV
jgi:hypothetical protein